MTARPYLRLVEEPPPPWPRIEVRISTTMERRPYGRSRSFSLAHRELAQLLRHAERLEWLAECPPDEREGLPMTKFIMGIDPGISGAVAFYFPEYAELIAAEDLPVADGEIDAATLASRIAQMAPNLAIVECGRSAKAGRLVNIQIWRGVRNGSGRCRRTKDPFAPRLSNKMEKNISACLPTRKQAARSPCACGMPALNCSNVKSTMGEQ